MQQNAPFLRLYSRKDERKGLFFMKTKPFFFFLVILCALLLAIRADGAAIRLLHL